MPASVDEGSGCGGIGLARERKSRFITQSGVEIDRVYTAADLHDPANDTDAGRPRYRSTKGEADEPGWDEIDDLDDLGLPGSLRSPRPDA